MNKIKFKLWHLFGLPSILLTPITFTVAFTAWYTHIFKGATVWVIIASGDRFFDLSLTQFFLTMVWIFVGFDLHGQYEQASRRERLNSKDNDIDTK